MSLAVTYPTDPLTAAEITAVSNAIKASPQLSPFFSPPLPLAETALITESLLKEPKKSYVEAYDASVIAGSPIPLNRKARTIVYRNTNNATYIVITSISEPSAPFAVTIDKIKLLDIVGYPYNNFAVPPVSDYWGGEQRFRVNYNTQGAYWNYFTRQELTDLVLENKCLMKLLKKRNVTREMLTPDYANPDYSVTNTCAQIYSYAFYSFEAFRNFIGACGKSCPDLISLCAKNHRYMPAVFFDQSIAPGGYCAVPSNWGFVDGIFIIVDCNAKCIYRIVDNGVFPPKGAPPIIPAVFDPYPAIDHLEPLDPFTLPPNGSLKPLLTAMPFGVSFFHENDSMHQVSWDNWTFHWGLQRSGLNIYNIRYRENVRGQVSPSRKIIYKASASDTGVIYNSAEPTVERTYVSMDSHNWPILPRLQELVRGRDIPAYAETFPVPVPSADGHGYDIPNAVAVYEQDNDLLWRVNQGVIDAKNWPNGYDSNGDPIGQPTTGAKKRQLVVRCIFSGFYYLFVYSYIFNQDGSMEYYIDLHGQTTNRWVEADATGAHVEGGQRITLQQVAMNHLHTTLWRLDFDIDGVRNEVHEHTYHKDESCETNPCGDVVIEKHTLLKTEKEGVRNLNIRHNTMWHVANPQSKNRLGFARGYMVSFVGMNGNSFANEIANGAAKTHVNYIKNQFYVTRYHRSEQFGVGQFPVLRDVTTGIEKYIEDDESIENEDIVVWMNSMHFHRPYTEDSAFITGARSGVKLQPANFLGMNASNTLEQMNVPYDGFPLGSCTVPVFKADRKSVV